MKSFRVLMFSALAVSLITLCWIPAVAEEMPIPDLQGTWSFHVMNTDVAWNQKVAEDGQGAFVGELYIYQGEYFPNELNLLVVPTDDPTDPFFGFVQGRRIALFKANQHGEPNMGFEMMTGVVAQDSTRIQSNGVGFDSNPDWGSTWSYKLLARKISDEVPALETVTDVSWPSLATCLVAHP